MKKIFLVASIVCSFNFINAQSLQDGLNAMDNEQFTKAKTILFSQLNAGGETSIQAYFLLAENYYLCSKPDSASLIINRGASLFGQSAYAKVAQGRMAIANKDEAGAKVFFDDAIKISLGKDSKIYQWIAYSYLQAGTPSANKSATDILTVALKSDSKNPDLYILLGDAYKRDPNGGGTAANNYEKAIESKMLDAKGNQRLGALYTEARNMESATSAFQKSIAANDKYAPAYRDYAFMFYTFKKYDLAVEQYKIYLSIADSSVYNLTRYVYALHQAKMYSDEIPIINQLMEMDSTNCVIHRLLAYAYAEQKKDPKNDSIALTNMIKFLKCVEPSKMIIYDYKYYGRLLSRTGDDSSAIIQLQKAYDMDSTDLDAITEYADVLYKSKHYKESAFYYEKKIALLKSPSAFDYYNLGRAYWFTKDTANVINADSAFMKVIEIKPTASTGYFWRFRVSNKYYSDSLERTFPIATKFLEIADVPDSKESIDNLVEVWDFMAVYYLKKDDEPKGIEYMNKILSKKPDYQRAKDMLEQLKKQKEQPKKQ